MAFEKSHTIESGLTAPGAYWKVVEIFTTATQAKIVFLAWADKASADAGKPPIPGVAKEYFLTGAAFAGFAGKSPKAGANLFDAIRSACYEGVKTIKDVDRGQKDNDGKPVLEGFFDGAKDV